MAFAVPLYQSEPLLCSYGRQDMYAGVHAVEIPRLAGADVFVQLERLILRQNADGIDAGVHTVGKREIDNAILASERHCGLCKVLRENPKAASAAACQQHGDYFLLR